jgi:uncharacterized protein (DUF58 family)
MGGFVAFGLLVLGLAVLLRLDYLFTVFYLLAVVLALSRIVSHHALKSLRASRILQGRAFLGDRVTVTITLRNTSRLHIPWLTFRDSFPVELATPPFYQEAITLGSMASYTAQYTLTASKRGCYEIGPLKLRSGDLLGIHQDVTGQVEREFLIVYPKIVPIGRLSLPARSPQPIMSTTVPLFPDATRLMGARDYCPGDNPRHIHWPATATAGRLKVKQFQPAIARDNAIFVNLCRRDYAERGFPEPAIELAITVAASLAHHMAITEGTTVGLFTVAVDPLVQQLETLARVQSLSDEVSFPESVRKQAVKLAWGTLAVVITSHLTEDLLQTLLLLRQTGFQVVLMLIDPPHSRLCKPGAAYRQTAAQELGIPTYRTTSERDIGAWPTVR